MGSYPLLPGTIFPCSWSSSILVLVLGTVRMPSSRYSFEHFGCVAVPLSRFDVRLDIGSVTRGFVKRIVSHSSKSCAESRWPISPSRLPYNYNHEINQNDPFKNSKTLKTHRPYI